MFWQDGFWQDYFWEDNFWEGLVVGGGDYTGWTVSDALVDALSAYDGTVNDRMFAYLQAQGFNGTLTDKLAAFGGKTAFLNSLGIFIK